MGLFGKKKGVPVITVGHMVATGTKVTLHSSIDSPTPISSFNWIHRSSLHGNNPVRLEIDGLKYSGATVELPSLVINNVKESDTGMYVCCATNSKGESESIPVHMLVSEGGILVVTITETKKTAADGDTVILQCSVNAEPPAKAILWEKNGKSITIDNLKYFGGSVNSPSLTIKEAKKDSDEGDYFCNAENSFESVKSKKVTLEISSRNTFNMTVSAEEESEDKTELKEVERKMKIIYIDMVTKLSAYLTPRLKDDWGTFQLQLEKHMDKVSIYGDDVTNLGVLCRHMVSKGVITERRYDILYESVKVVDVRAAQIVEKATTEIKKLEGGGMPDTKSFIFIVPVDGLIDISSEAKTHIQNIVANDLNIPKERVSVRFLKEGLAMISFEFSGAISRVEPSALSIATKLKERLKQGKIQVTDETNSPLPLRPNAGIIHRKDTPVATANKANVSICYGKYVKTEGQKAVLDCVVSASPKANGVTWFRILNEEEVLITIDDKKYFGASVDSPSLTIDDLTRGDQGAYYCKVSNSMGVVAESNTTMLHVTLSKTKTIQRAVECTEKVRKAAIQWQREIPEMEQMCKKMYRIQAAQQLKFDNKLGGYVCGFLCVTCTLLGIYLPLALPVGGFAGLVAFLLSHIMRNQLMSNFTIKGKSLITISGDLQNGMGDFKKNISTMEVDDTVQLILLDIFSELSFELIRFQELSKNENSDAIVYYNMLKGLHNISNLLTACIENLEKCSDELNEIMDTGTRFY